MAYKIAIYLRLSKEDDRECDESNSITNQRFLIRNFISGLFQDVDYEILEFVDDGYSGKNFERPAVKRLLELVRHQEIDCIIVKDYSRFSRDYVEAGAYLEQIFPFLGIRFISVNDGYDSDDYKGTTGGIEQAFKNLINDMYSQDISVKVKASLDSKKERGIYCSANCPFGYKKKKGNPNEVEIIEEEAAIVRRIFKMTLAGNSLGDIAKKFNKEGVKTPIEFMIARGVTHRVPVGKKFYWQTATICSILKNDFYVGDVVYGKYKKYTVGGKKHIRPRSEWKVYRNHHEAIIEREVFDTVQGMRKSNKGEKKNETHYLQGKLICGVCGKSLAIRHSLNPYFYCNDKYYTGSENCVKQINIMLLEQIILYALQKELEKQINIEEMRTYYMDTLHQKHVDVGTQLRETGGQMRGLQTENLQLYERYTSGELTKETYLDFKQVIEKKKEELQHRILELERKLENIETEMGKNKTDKENLPAFLQVQKLDKDVVELFIHKIRVFDEKNIEIEWNFKSDTVTNF